MSPQLDMSVAPVLGVLDTIFSGGILLLLLGIVWRGSSFVQWVKDQFEKNDEAHKRLEGSVSRIKDRVGVLEDDG